MEESPQPAEQKAAAKESSPRNYWMYFSVLLMAVLVFTTYQSYATNRMVMAALTGQAVAQQNNGIEGTAPAAAPRADVNSGNAHFKGSSNAKVTIIEYSDFQCPYCGRALPTLQQVLETYGDKVRIGYKHFPLSFHQNAENAALASECAAEQGRFWEYHDILFSNQQALDAGSLKGYASQMGLDTGKFNQCLDSKKYLNIVRQHMQEGTQEGVDGTPAFFINGALISGAQPFEAFRQVIDAELNK